MIDWHVHVWDSRRHLMPWLEPPLPAESRLEQWLASVPAGTRGVLVEAGVDAAHAGREERWLAQLAKHDAVAGIITAAPIGSSSFSVWADDHPASVIGIRRSLAEWTPLSPVASEHLEELAVQGLSLDLDLPAERLKLAVRISAAHPELTLVVDHLGHPQMSDMDSWTRSMTTLAENENVKVKLSGRHEPCVIGPAIEVLVDLFGRTRLLFGSDWPISCDSPRTWLDWASRVVEIS